MNTLREAAQQALEALEDMLGWQSLAPQTIQESAKGRAAALRAALAEPQEPYAWMAVGGTVWRHKSSQDDVPLYTAPFQRKPLPVDQIYEMYNEPRSDAEMVEFARAIERAHGIGGKDV